MTEAGTWVCLLAPLASAVAITLAGGAISRRLAGVVATLSTFLAFAGAAAAFAGLWREAPEEREHLYTAYTWLAAGDLSVDLQLLLDPLSAVMMLVVSGVGGLIVWYSIGYMDGDDEERRYFAYMSLFVFAMLLLVQAGNYLLLLVGWGLVGLASYLLIGFWHTRPEAVAAAKKAFIVNAVGDATMALAFFVLIWQLGTLSFAGVEEGLFALTSTEVNLVALGLLGGAVAKSAQLPLHTWLPDAMEGPTPVSALIHAATMVTAGVYLLVRTHPVFEAAPDVQALAAIVGAATLLVAGLIALVQNDIKRVIAYSTMSQIGYMVMGAGVGAYGFAIFHLMTHAFFKALLFMTAGLVIHHLAGEQDIRRMGGLKDVLPRTRIAFLVGTLALVGVVPFSGFWSKDAILASTAAEGGWKLGLYFAGLVGTLLTGLYAFRLYFAVFHGEQSDLVRGHAAGHGEGHAHGPEDAAGHGSHGRGEGPLSMTLPVAVLAVLAAVGGLLVVPGSGWHPFTEWLHGVAEPLLEPTVRQEWLTSAAALLLGLMGGYFAWLSFKEGRELVGNRLAHSVLERKLYVDELYDALFSRPAQLVASRLRTDVEAPAVERPLGEIAHGALEAGSGVARLQTGLLRSYTLAIALSVIVLGIVFVVVR